jgi:hypothetical protein
MFNSQKHTFWQALVVTVVIFGIGIFVGILLENSRIGEINDIFYESEIDLLDIRVQNEIYATGDFNCELAIDENIKFADKIYEEGKILDRYEKASRLSPEKLKIQHKKYDILRAMLLLNSLEIKSNCNDSYSNVIYFYQYNNPRLDLKSKQNVFSRLLGELKNDYGNEILLIPMAADNDISSINILLDKYDIEFEDLPVILIDEEIKITEIQNIEELRQYFE